MSSHTDYRNCPECEGKKTLESTWHGTMLGDESTTYQRCYECGYASNNEEFVADLEEVNETRESQEDEDGEPLPPLTPAEFTAIRERIEQRRRDRLAAHEAYVNKVHREYQAYKEIAPEGESI